MTKPANKEKKTKDPVLAENEKIKSISARKKINTKGVFSNLREWFHFYLLHIYA